LTVEPAAKSGEGTRVLSPVPAPEDQSRAQPERGARVETGTPDSAIEERREGKKTQETLRQRKKKKGEETNGADLIWGGKGLEV